MKEGTTYTAWETPFHAGSSSALPVLLAGRWSGGVKSPKSVEQQAEIIKHFEGGKWWNGSNHELQTAETDCPTLSHLPSPHTTTGRKECYLPTSKAACHLGSDFNGNLEAFLYSTVMLYPFDFFYFFSSALCSTPLPGAKPAGSS